MSGKSVSGNEKGNPMSDELEDLKKRVAELEKAAKPAEPFKSDYRGPVDYTANATQAINSTQGVE